MLEGRRITRRAFLRLSVGGASTLALAACTTEPLPAKLTQPAASNVSGAISAPTSAPAATATTPTPVAASATPYDPTLTGTPASVAPKQTPRPTANATGAYGWTGKLLDVDLSAGRTEVKDSRDLHRQYLGGRGVAARLAWDEIPRGAGPFDPENRLMILAGALTGTMAPYSGRCGVYAISPQAYPKPVFSRAGLGGHFGPEMKYAGYDGIVVHGQASEPVYLYVENGKAEIRPAGDLWGQGIYAAQRKLTEELGGDTRIVAIGQAGEKLSRIAVIATETQSAAGQGGFGAVMGSKKLKAIAVRGSGTVRAADPEPFFERCGAVAKETRQARCFDAYLDPDHASRYGARLDACTQECARSCGATYYRNVPSVLRPGATNSGQMHCAAFSFGGFPGTFMNWKIGFEGGFDLASVAGDYGINHWDLVFGIFPWLRACREEGSLTELDGMPIDLDNIQFWAEVLRKMAFREGIGDVLAEGGRRAADALGAGKDAAGKLYPAWGSAGHWDGHGDHGNYVPFPFWLVPAIQWAMDSRDPIASGHGYASQLMRFSQFSRRDKTVSWEAMGQIGQRIYGTPEPFNPRSGYGLDKATAAVWHIGRSVLKDSLGLDDYIFPRIFSLATEDGMSRSGDVLGPSFEHWMFQAATGARLTEDEMHFACERVHNLERALLIRDANRSRQDDESIIPYFSEPENWASPYLGAPQRLDAGKFRAMLDEFYRLKGWDVETGAPTAARLSELGLGDVAEGLARMP